MSIATAITAAQAKIANAYTAVSEKGGTLPETQNLNNLPTAISSISGGGSSTKYGASIDSFLGDVNASGVLFGPATNTTLDFSGVTSFYNNALNHKFYGNSYIKGVLFPDLTTISGSYSAYYAFSGCSLDSVDLSSLTAISGSNSAGYMFDHASVNEVLLPNLTTISGSYSANHMFEYNYCTSIDLTSLTSISGESVANSMFYYSQRLVNFYSSSLTSISGSNSANSMFNTISRLKFVDLSSLTSISGSGAASNMFSYSGITSIDLSSLTSIYGSSALNYTFYSCSSFPSIRFPMLQKSDTNSWATNTFLSDTLLTEIHFRKDMSDIVPTWTGYGSKFGATNATIYFDLVGKITVDGTTYDRSEQDSIRSNHIKQYVGWVDGSITVGGTVYKRDSSKDNVKDAQYSQTLYKQAYGWTNGSTTLYTKDRIPTTASGVYTNIEATTSAGTITDVVYNKVYTAFDDTTKAEPDVGTTVYSDAGQTSIGTISAVA